ncbi:MAG: hypothetical protein ACJ8AW_07375 [Rhodopila sp.]
MQSNLKATLAGAATLVVLAGLTSAFAGEGQRHLMSVRMPDGSVLQVAYFGDVQPRVVVTPAPVAAGTPPFDAPAGFGPSFTALQRMADMMDRQAELMMRQMSAQMAAMQDAAMNSTLSAAPPGGQSYSVSSSTGTGVCIRSVQITYNGSGAPHVVSHTGGNCGQAQGGEAPASVNGPLFHAAPTPSPQPHTIEVRANRDTPVLAMAQPVFSGR